MLKNTPAEKKGIMKKYWQDPIIIISTILSLIISFFLIKYYVKGLNAEPKQAPIAPVAQQTLPSSSSTNITVDKTSDSGLVLNKMQTKEVGIYSVGPNGDTADLSAAICQASPTDLIKLSSGNYTLNIDFYNLEQKNLHIIGEGKNTNIRLEKSMMTSALLTLENLVIDGPSDKSAIRGRGNAIITLNNVTMKNSFSAFSISNDVLLKINDSTIERMENYCISQSGRSRSEISNSNFNYCLAGAISADLLSYSTVNKTTFNNSRSAFVVKRDSNTVSCFSCSYDKVRDVKISLP